MRAVALEGAFAYLEQHAQILIVEKADAFRDSGLFPLSLHRQQQFVLMLALRNFSLKCSFVHLLFQVLNSMICNFYLFFNNRHSPCKIIVLGNLVFKLL